MSTGELLYRPGWEEARARLAAWWNGGDIGRPAMCVHVPRAKPVEDIPALPQPQGWLTDYSTRSLDYRVNLALRACTRTDYYGEAVPFASPGNLAPNCLALYLGCKGVEMPDTVWCEPFIDDPDTARFAHDPGNFYWNFTLEAIKRTQEQARGKSLIEFPDLIEGLDTLAAMRGSDRLLVDLIERPDWVRASLRKITDLYFRYYDVLYDLIRDDMGGSVMWAWAPGRMAKVQCDISAMMSPGMFQDFMAPIFAEMTERISYSLYHWDGAAQHHDALLALPRLGMLAWNPPAGATYAPDHWWPMYHKSLDAGKKLMLAVANADALLALKREFGAKCKHMLISCQARSAEQADQLLRMMEL